MRPDVADLEDRLRVGVQDRGRVARDREGRQLVGADEALVDRGLETVLGAIQGLSLELHAGVLRLLVSHRSSTRSGAISGSTSRSYTASGSGMWHRLRCPSLRLPGTSSGSVVTQRLPGTLSR